MLAEEPTSKGEPTMTRGEQQVEVPIQVDEAGNSISYDEPVTYIHIRLNK